MGNKKRIFQCYMKGNIQIIQTKKNIEDHMISWSVMISKTIQNEQRMTMSNKRKRNIETQSFKENNINKTNIIHRFYHLHQERKDRNLWQRKMIIINIKNITKKQRTKTYI